MGVENGVYSISLEVNTAYCTLLLSESAPIFYLTRDTYECKAVTSRKGLNNNRWSDWPRFRLYAAAAQTLDLTSARMSLALQAARPPTSSSSSSDSCALAPRRRPNS